MVTLAQIRAAIRKIVQNYPIKKISLFGSYAQGVANDNSDLDFLIEFNTPAISLFTISDLKYRMEEELHVPVDLIHGPLPEDSFLKIEKVIDIYEQ
jgi:hypothetical protein